MNIKDYQSLDNFDRNQAIFTLFTQDKYSLDQLATQFSLSVKEVEQIVAVHTEYMRSFND